MTNPNPRWFRATTLIIAAAAGGLTCGCTPAQRAEAGSVLAAAPSLAPVTCAIVASAGGNGTACGPIAEVVAEVAADIGKILASWPAPRVVGVRPAVIVVRGVSVTLREDAAAFVLVQMGGAK